MTCVLAEPVKLTAVAFTTEKPATAPEAPVVPVVPVAPLGPAGAAVAAVSPRIALPAQRGRYTGMRTDAEGKRRNMVGWEFVHIAIDDATRLACVEVLDDEKAQTNGKACVLAWGCRPIGRRGSPHLLV